MGRRSRESPVHGWLILDKPVGLSSTQAVSRLKRLFQSRKAGHAGTLDPLASGCLPVAFGEATKTVPFVVDGQKTYRFTVRWGVETDTDDAEGKVVATSDTRPSDSEIDAILPGFTGTIEQVPPQYSAIKIDGERAYALARQGEVVEMPSRRVEILSLARTGPTAVNAAGEEETEFECQCGKGTYVRALARDFGRILDTRGHVVALRRVAVGPFSEEDMIPLDKLEELCNRASGQNDLATTLRSVETALDDIPALAITRSDAARLRNGQPVLLRGRDAPVLSGPAYATTQGKLVALVEADRGELHPKRVFNLPG